MRRSPLIALALTFVLVGAACSEKKDTGFPAPSPESTVGHSPEPTGTEPVEVTGPIDVGDSFFAPLRGEVKAGAKIQWHQSGVAPHSVTFDKLKIDSSPGCSIAEAAKCLQKDGEFDATIAAPGTYHYYCVIHGAKGSDVGMFGYIIVE